MANKGSQYSDLGIDAHKGSVKASFKSVIDNDYPLAFCNIVGDRLNPGYVLTQHMDGDGSKFIQRLLHYWETGDLTVFQGAADDALSMNTGDIAASGFVDEYVVTDVININGVNAPKDLIMEQLSARFGELKAFYTKRGIFMPFLGGETADLPDQVKSIVFDIAVSSRADKNMLIKGNVQPGDSIFGMASNGRATWESEYNSGIMSNGLTMARLKLMSSKYNDKYPDLVREDKPFTGRFTIDTAEGLAVSNAIMSPTRQWAIVIRQIISTLIGKGCLSLLHGIVMNTGGGASKILNIGEGICYEKTMPEPPEIFQLINQESEEIWEHMFTTFNCGVGIDIIGSDDSGILSKALSEVSQWSGIELFELGHCSESGSGKNQVRLTTDYGDFVY